MKKIDSYCSGDHGKSVLNSVSMLVISAMLFSLPTLADDFQEIGYVLRGVGEIQKTYANNRQDFNDFINSQMLQIQMVQASIAQRQAAGQLVGKLNGLLLTDMSPRFRQSFLADGQKIIDQGGTFQRTAPLLLAAGLRHLQAGGADHHRAAIHNILTAMVINGASVEQVINTFAGFFGDYGQGRNKMASNGAIWEASQLNLTKGCPSQ